MHALEEAKQFLRAELASGPVRSTQVQKDAGALAFQFRPFSGRRRRWGSRAGRTMAAAVRGAGPCHHKVLNIAKVFKILKMLTLKREAAPQLGC